MLILPPEADESVVSGALDRITRIVGEAGGVLLPGDDSMIGRYFTVELTGTTGSTFTGAVCHKRERTPLPMAG